MSKPKKIDPPKAPQPEPPVITMTGDQAKETALKKQAQKSGFQDSVYAGLVTPEDTAGKTPKVTKLGTGTKRAKA